MFKKLILAAVTVFAVGAFSIALNSPTSYADGNGSPNECKGSSPNVIGSQGGEDNGGSANVATVNVGAGNVVDGVCIKSGNNMFNGNKHSGVLGNGTYENGCYQVVGVGTQQVTVTRLKSGPSCQGISHIDVVVGGQQVDYCDPAQRPNGKSIKKWHEANNFDGNCVDFGYAAACGSLDAFLTTNKTGLFYEVVGLVGSQPFPSGHPVANSTNVFPITFDEDEFGGSVDVYLWLEGAEKDFVTDRNIPNFWEQNAVAVTVDTDCEDENGFPTPTPLTPTSTDVEEEEEVQVEAPAGGVNAGSGDAATAAVAAVTLISSLASVAYGVVRFTKFGA